MDLDRLKKKMGAVSTNIAIYTDHLKKNKQKLVNEYDLEREDVQDRLGEIEDQIKDLRDKKQTLFNLAQKRLKRIKENVE